MDLLDTSSPGRQFRHLVVNERQQRTDNERRPLSCESRQLVAERLSGAGGHDDESIPPRDDRLADLFLRRTELVEAESFLKKNPQ